MTTYISHLDCRKFIKDPTVNPLTGRKISKDGAVAKKLFKECEKNHPENVSAIKNSTNSPSNLKIMLKDLTPYYKLAMKKMGFKKDKTVEYFKKKYGKSTKTVILPKYGDNEDLKSELEDMDLKLDSPITRLATALYWKDNHSK